MSCFQGKGGLGRCHCLMLSFLLRRVGEGQGAQKRDAVPADSALKTFTSRLPGPERTVRAATLPLMAEVPRAPGEPVLGNSLVPVVGWLSFVPARGTPSLQEPSAHTTALRISCADGFLQPLLRCSLKVHTELVCAATGLQLGACMLLLCPGVLTAQPWAWGQAGWGGGAPAGWGQPVQWPHVLSRPQEILFSRICCSLFLCFSNVLLN